MLANHNRPTIHYLYGEDQLGGGQIRHNYKFFIVVRNRIFNVSGIISMLFGVMVQDRHQAFSINTMPKTEDVKGFTDALRKHIGLEELVLEDLLLNAEQPMEYTIAPGVLEFLGKRPI